MAMHLLHPLDTKNGDPNGTAEGTAGPQEVVDAIEVIVEQLEEVQEAIPAEPSNEEVSPQPEDVAVDETQDVAPAPDEPEIVAKLNARIAELESQNEKQAKEQVAQAYADLYDVPRVQEAKFNEVVASKEPSGVWRNKIAAIESYRNEIQGVNSYKPAQNTTSWLTPRTRVAKQTNELEHL